MNLISNNCLGARFYQINNIDFNNPFMWNWIEPDHFENLVKNFNDIDLYNISAQLEYHRHDNEHKSVLITLEGGIEVHYIHHLYDPNVQIEEKKGIDIYSNKILNYCVNKYYTRLDRMKRTKEEPIFVYAMNTISETDTKWSNAVKDFVDMNRNDVYVLTYNSLRIKYNRKTNTNVYGYPYDVMQLHHKDFCNNTINKIFKNI